MKNTITEGDNLYLKSLSADYWNGDFEKLHLSIHIYLDPNATDHGVTNLLGYKTLESIKVILNYEDNDRDFTLSCKDSSTFSVETDVRVRVDYVTQFILTVYGLYIDPERGVELIKIGVVLVSTPISHIIAVPLINEDELTTGSVK
jgi:hypothetical protein